MIRIGHGYDVHRLCENRKMIIGGVEIENELGLLGHSDADVLTHALMDALLGAMGLGDIGKLFPDTDDSFKGISSLILLERVKGKMDELGYTLGNADCTIIAQKPKMAPHIDAMAENFARILDVPRQRINVKATTEEKLGFTGRLEGISAHAVCIIEKNNL